MNIQSLEEPDFNCIEPPQAFKDQTSELQENCKDIPFKSNKSCSTTSSALLTKQKMKLEAAKAFSFVGVDTFGPWPVAFKRTRGVQTNQKR